MISKIPIFRRLLKYENVVSIQGVSYLLEFRYQQRSDRWYLSIYSEDREPLQLGIRLVNDYFLLKNIPGLPDGQLMMVRNDELDRDADEQDFGVLNWLAFISQDELNAGDASPAQGLTFLI